VSYHQKHFCSHCRTLSRNVRWHPLMGEYLHYECWLDVKACAIGYGSDPEQRSDPLTDPKPNHPFKLTLEEQRANLDLFLD